MIKGNISFDTGEAIYHVPGQAFYDQTVSNEDYGEPAQQVEFQPNLIVRAASKKAA